MSSNSIRVSADLFERALERGELMSRSAAQQIEHWARLGAALEARGLSVADTAQLLQVLREPDPVYAEAAAESELWAFKRQRQAKDLARVRAGAASNAQMSWFSDGRARSAQLVDSPL